jgi:hypothetical protein
MREPIKEGLTRRNQKRLQLDDPEQIEDPAGVGI